MFVESKLSLLDYNILFGNLEVQIILLDFASIFYEAPSCSSFN